MKKNIKTNQKKINKNLKPVTQKCSGFILRIYIIQLHIKLYAYDTDMIHNVNNYA